MVAVRPEQLELGEAIPACGRALIMMYLTQAFACGSKAGALPQGFERMGFLNAGLLSARHAAFYTPTVSRPKLSLGASSTTAAWSRRPCTKSPLRSSSGGKS